MPLDEACAAFIRTSQAEPPLPQDPALRLAEIRSRAEAMGRSGFAPRPVHAVRDFPEARLRTFSPASAKPLPILIWVHGGSWTRGSLASHDGIFRTIANDANTVVVAIDYRLAPESRFPNAIDEVLDAVRWSCVHGADIGGDPSRISLGGDSSGANIAAAAALSARDRGGYEIASQVLLIPLLDTRFNSASWDRLDRDYLLSRADLEWALALYAPGGDRSDWRLSPLAAHDLAGLPPAIVVTAEFDPLRDDGAQYAAKLRASGVSVDYVEWPGMIHHSVLAAGAMPVGAAAVAHLCERLRRLVRDT
jgi:acetyl esterase/lipase